MIQPTQRPIKPSRSNNFLTIEVVNESSHFDIFLHLDVLEILNFNHTKIILKVYVCISFWDKYVNLYVTLLFYKILLYKILRFLSPSWEFFIDYLKKTYFVFLSLEGLSPKVLWLCFQQKMLQNCYF